MFTLLSTICKSSRLWTSLYSRMPSTDCPLRFLLRNFSCLYLLYHLFLFFFFFFQAEDGIRDLIVTGVQTCALPIFLRKARSDSVKASETKAAASPSRA